MVHEQPAIMIDDGSGNRVDRHNLRTAAWGGLIGTALEQYDLGAALLEGPHAACGMTSWA